MQTPRALAASLLALIAGCALRARPVALPPLESEGEVYVYLEPFPHEADRLSFDLTVLSAAAEDGTEVPFALSSRTISGAAMRDQRLIARGRLAPGSFSGFVIGVEKATLASEQGKSALLAPREPTRIPFPFRLRPKQAIVVSLSFQYAESVEGGFGFRPVLSAVSPARTAVQQVGYCSNAGGASLTVFDKRTKRVTGVVPTGAGPQGIALDPLASRAYVALSGEDQIDVIDLAAGTSVGRIRLSGGDRPRELALTPDGRLLVVVNAGSRTVSFIDPVSTLELGRARVGDEPSSLLLDRTGTRAYVFNRRGNPASLTGLARAEVAVPGSITVLDVPNRSIAATVTTDPEPLRGQVNRAGSRLYVIHGGSPYLTIFSVPDLAVVNRVYVGLGAQAIKIDPRTDLVYVGMEGESALRVFDPFSSLPVDDFALAAPASYAAIDDAENEMVVLMPSRRAIAAVDLTSRKTLAVLDVGTDPYAVVLSGERN